MSGLEKFKAELRSSLKDKKNNDKEYNHFFDFRNKFEMRTIKDDHNLYLKCGALLLANVLEKF